MDSDKFEILYKQNELLGTNVARLQEQVHGVRKELADLIHLVKAYHLKFDALLTLHGVNLYRKVVT